MDEGYPYSFQKGYNIRQKWKKLAISASIETLYARPIEIKDAKEVSYRIAEALDMDREDVLDRLTRNVDTVLLKRRLKRRTWTG